MGVIQKETMILSKNQLIALYHLMVKANDFANANKIIDLFNKTDNAELNIGFTGHFSAGKSSIINYLLNKNILPSSPIPTSANIVKIKSGDGNVKIYFEEGPGFEYDEPYDINTIKDYCMDKSIIKQIEMNLSQTTLPENIVVMDTPGIDAADDTDRFITESALHLVDVLFYVMDYNHVQSEVNLQFLKKIQQQNIPIFIIINQIDKHNEVEIAFKHFENSINQTFDQWKITPQKVYFTSIYDEYNPYNELLTMKKDFYHLLNQNKNEINRTFIAAKQLIKDHIQYIKSKYSNKMQFPVSEKQIKTDDFKRIEAALVQLHSVLPKLKKEFHSEIEITLKNAYIMPASLRDLAGPFLESQQKGFKIGLFNSRKKTEVEKNLRLESFLQALQKSITTSIQWKLREKLMILLQNYDINDERILQQIQNFTINYNESNLIPLIKQGATINGNYILNYTNDISTDIKNKFRQKGNEIWKEIEKHYEPILDEKIKEVEIEKQNFKNKMKLLKNNAKLQNDLKHAISKIDEVFYYPIVTELEEKEFINSVTKNRKTIKQRNMDVLVTDKTEMLPGEEVSATVNIENQYNVSTIIQTLERVITEIEQVDGFTSIVSDLQKQKYKLSNRTLTIALFGAFSAGKSSFANALFGEQILPVSPNPTTAVINRITAPTHEYPHGTAKIAFKSEHTIIKDIQRITNDNLKQGEHFIDFVHRVLNHDKNLSEMYQAYLMAILNGYKEMKDDIGGNRVISMEGFPSFITDETKACFIETVDLYYDCSLTQKGITIVDTPGANSVNARHTNVAFDYIKNADAILYVTYFNHAITSADRDFLLQLGRVKEAFELDKMFFIVNAADLAHTKDDLKLVKDYIEDQLVKFGIRQPKIFSVSSKLSLEEKQHKQPLNNEMQDFEQTLYTFIEEDLAQLMLQSAIWDVKRAKTTLQQLIQAANLDIAERDTYKLQLNDKRITCMKMIENEDSHILKQQLKERIERQLYYVMERLYIRFHDMFSEHFNPTTITSEGKQAQEELLKNGKKLIDYVGYELLQEIRAVSLRIESYMNELLHLANEDFHKNMKNIDELFTIPSYQPPEIETPYYEQALTALDVNEFTKIFKLFKNKRSFFENNEREKMKEKFYEILKPFANQYITKAKKIMDQQYELQFEEIMENMKQQIIHELNQIIDRQLQLFTKPSQVDVLQEKHNVIKQITKSLI